MGKEIKTVKLTIMETANGYYVEHEANNKMNGYAVECEKGEWDRLNPVRAGFFDTMFTAEDNENSTSTNETAVAKIAELEAQLEEAEQAKQELATLKEAAGDIDILQAIEKMKAGKIDK